MSIYLDPAALRQAWLARGADARGEVRVAARRTPDAAGHDLAGLADRMAGAAEELAGVLDVLTAVIDEYGEGVEGCLVEYAATDGASAGAFRGLAR